MMVKFDLLDRKIMFELDLDSRLPVTQLAKKVHASKDTVNFRLKKLVQDGFIKNFITTIYTSHLNLFYYKLFYRFHKTTPEIDKKIISFIQDYGKTAWFGSFEGPYDLAFLIISKSVYDLENFLKEFRKLFGDYILEQEIHTLTSVHRFNLKFFHNSERVKHTQYPKELQVLNLDEVDYKILTTIANNSRVPIIDLARDLNIDSSTILYRLANLKKKKVLGTHTLAVDFSKFGVQHYQINFILKNHEAISKLVTYFSNHKNATFATTTIGKYDLAVELVAEDNLGLRKILDDVNSKFSSDINDHDTFLIVKEHNVTWLPKNALQL